MKKFLILLLLFGYIVIYAQYREEVTTPRVKTINAAVDDTTLQNNAHTMADTFDVLVGITPYQTLGDIFLAFRYDTNISDTAKYSEKVAADSGSKNNGKLPAIRIRVAKFDADFDSILVHPDSSSGSDYLTIVESLKVYNNYAYWDLTDSLPVVKALRFIADFIDDSLAADSAVVDSFTAAGYGKGQINPARRVNFEWKIGIY